MVKSEIVVVGPEAGKLVPRRFGERTIVKASGDETAEAYAVRENTVPASFSGVPLHIHHTAEEAFYVLDGELTVFNEAEAISASTGSFVLIPRGVVHSIANRGAAPVRFLTLLSPAWVSGWIEAEAKLMSSGDEPDDDALAELYARYDLEIVGPPPS